MQYSPVPHKDFMKPVLETTAEDLQGPFAFSVGGPVTAVRNILPGMRELGRGTVLFVNGGFAVQLIIPGAITRGDDRKDPDVLAGLLFDIHRERTGFRHFAEPLDS